jgi:hypothetical protein
MKDLSGKTTGSSYPASEFNDFFTENKHQVESSGQGLSEGDQFQAAKSLGIYAADGDFYTDSGSSTAYILAPVASRKCITAYKNGARIRFKAANSNTTGTPTVNVGGLGVKDIKDVYGGELLPGQIAQNRYITLIYQGTYFILADNGKGAGIDRPYSYGALYGGLCNQDVGDTQHDLKFEWVSARGANDLANIYIPKGSSLTKQIDAPWTEGNNQGGFPSGISLSPNTWYHCFYIAKEDGTTDSGVDSSITATNLLADATGYVDYIRTESFRADASSNITDYIMYILPGKQRLTRWITPPNDLHRGDVGSSYPSIGSIQTLPLTVPPNVNVEAKFLVALTQGTSGATALVDFSFWSPYQTTPSGYSNFVGTSDTQPRLLASMDFYKMTDTNRQIKWKVDAALNTWMNSTLKVRTYGWVE